MAPRVPDRSTDLPRPRPDPVPARPATWRTYARLVAIVAAVIVAALIVARIYVRWS